MLPGPQPNPMTKLGVAREHRKDGCVGALVGRRRDDEADDEDEREGEVKGMVLT